MRRPALLDRFPKVVWRPNPDAVVVPPSQLRADFPELSEDLAVWDFDLGHRFRTLDRSAQRLENRFWQRSVALILGSTAAGILGAVQAAIGGGNAWIAAIQAVLAGLLAGLAVLTRGRGPQQGYLTDRLKAERLKSEYFLFLARAGDYADEEGRLRILGRRVSEIESAGT